MPATGYDVASEIVERPYHEPFVISRSAVDRERALVVRLKDGAGHRGQGEALGITYEGETPETMQAQLATVSGALRDGVTRDALLDLLPPGGARNAIDAALWDIEARRSGVSSFARAGTATDPVTSSRTIGIQTGDGYAAKARAYARSDSIKIKVDARDPLAAIAAVHANAPQSRLIVDPNQAWTVDQLKALAPELARLGVDLIEQPIAVGAEAALDGYDCPVPLAADELIHDARDLAKARGRFDFVNIKLDKAGGLTAALILADAAAAQGFGLMVGCMGGSSLSMAPAMIVAQRCRFIDLDAPLFLVDDLAGGFRYEDGHVAEPYLPGIWS